MVNTLVYLLLIFLLLNLGYHQLSKFLQNSIFYIFTLTVCGQQLIIVNEVENDSLMASIEEANMITSVSTFNEAKAELERAQDFLQKKGFLLASSTLRQASTDSIFVQWELGPKFNQLQINFTEEQLADFQAINLGIKDSILSLSFEDYENFTQQVLYAYTEAGLPFVKLQLKDMQQMQDTLRASFDIASGKRRKIGKIYIKPYEKFPRAFITHQVRIKTGQVFKKETLNKRMQRIEAIPFVRSVKNPEVQFTKDSTHIYMYLEKINANSFDGFIGFSNSEGGSLELNGYIDLMLINNLNWGESLVINYKNDGRDQQRFRVNAELPFLASSPFSLETGLDFFRKDTTFSNTQTDLRLNYQLTHQLRLSANSQWVTSTNLLTSPQTVTTDPVDSFNGNFYGLGLHFRQRREQIGVFLNTTRLHLNTFIGNRVADFGKNEQFKVEFSGEHSFKLTNRTYFFTASHFRWLSSDRYVDNELYRFGGIQSIRGFEENSLVASTYATLQTELRYYLSANLYANSVLDYGFFENDLRGISERLYSVGFGLGLDTPAGILRLIFANGASDSQDFAFDNTQVHLSLNTFF